MTVLAGSLGSRLLSASTPIDLAAWAANDDGDDVGGRPDAWKYDAVCAQTDPEMFFPEKGGSTREAKRVCLSCEVREKCLEYAIANDERFGIWGGYSERERRRLARGENVVATLGQHVNRRPNGHRHVCICPECRGSEPS